MWSAPVYAASALLCIISDRVRMGQDRGDQHSLGGPSSVVAIGPSAVSTVDAVSPSGSYRESLARHCANEALNLGLVVVGSHAGADERVQSARGQIACARAKRAGHVDVHVHGGQPVARLARRFALLEEGDD